MEVTTASVFMSGRSQAVRIPKAYRLDTKRVSIRKRGEALVIEPLLEEDPWASLKEVVGSFPKDFFANEEVTGPEYPRMGFDESEADFEKRVRHYEKLRGRAEQSQRRQHDK